MRWLDHVRRVAALLPALLGISCGDGGPATPATPAPSASQTVLAAPSETAVAPAPRRPAPVREGGALARSADSDELFLADEDHGVVRRLPLPLGQGAAEAKMPGRPAQVLPLDGRVLATIRDPGLLVVLRSRGPEALGEVTRVAVPPDAWGIAVTPDEKIALVTSAWAHAVTAVDLAANEVLWSIDVAREPRGVVVTPDGEHAYVTHLIGERVTRIDDLRGTPRVATFPLEIAPAPGAAPSNARKPASDPARAPRGGSLAYAAVLSPDGSRLLVPHHRVLGLGPTRWFGDPTVDVVWTKTDAVLLPAQSPGASYRSDLAQFSSPEGEYLPSFVVARAAVYRKSASTLLVASEATDELLELNARSLMPAEQPVKRLRLGQSYHEQAYAAARGGAPSGIALSEDERTAYVFCRSTYDIATVSLGDGAAADPGGWGRIDLTRIAEDPLPEDEAVGRRLFYTAMDPDLSDGVSCATCHPEGRDDGFVWHDNDGHFLSMPVIQGFSVQGLARQTPMIAGRVSADGPYGWLAESPNLKSRIIAGFGLHRWFSELTGRMRAAQVTRDDTKPGDPTRKHRGEHLAMFIRRGLVPPPALYAGPPEVVERGKQLFEDEKVGCAGCHVPRSEYTNRAAVVLPPGRRAPGFVEEPDVAFKTPSLLYVAGTAPYYHDGSAETLEQLVEQNGNRMGRTAHLPLADRAALVAFLKSIGWGAAATSSPVATASGEAPPIPTAAPVSGPPPSDSPAGAASASASAASAVPVPRTRKPTSVEWKEAAPFRLARAATGCSALALREWIRIRCDGGAFRAFVRAGPTEGAELWEGKVEPGMFAVFSLRPGDRKVVVFTGSVGLGKYGALESAGHVVSATWLDGEEPTIVID